LEKGGLSIQHIEGLVRDESKGWNPFLAGFPYFEFVRVVEAYPDVDAVIALCGPPYDTRQNPASDASEFPKLLVAGGPEGGAAESLVEEGRLYAATVPRRVEKDGKPTIIYELLRRE
jgi:hypothetical protein